MDGRLLEASRTGDVESLQSLVSDDPLMLRSISLLGGETPLHVSTMSGHLKFVQEILKLKRDFAWELNQDGFTALDIASANGYVEIVKEILELDQNLCLVKGRDLRIPLHYAAIKGRVQVIRELLAASPDSITEVTSRGETPLHLAVQNNKFEALKVLVEHVKVFKKEGVFDIKDEQGCTLLHLAVWKKQYEVIDLLLGNGIMEVNPLNNVGLTPLDVLLCFPSEAGDREIAEILVKNGSLKAKDLQHSSQNNVVENNSSNEQTPAEEGLSPAIKLLEYFKFNKVRDSPGEVRTTLLVIAVLIATATYQAGLSPPGGVWQDDVFSSNNNATTNATMKPHTAGKSVMGSKNFAAYGLFLFFNSVGFYASLDMIYMLTSGFPLRIELLIALTSLTATYDVCMLAITPNYFSSLFFSGTSIVVPLLVPAVATMLANKYPRVSRGAERSTRSKRPYSAVDDVPPSRYADPGVRHSRARVDYELSGSGSQYGDGYSDRIGRSSLGYGSGRSSLSDTHGLYSSSSRQGAGYGGGSYGASDVGGGGSGGGDYMSSRGSDVGGGGGSSYMGSGDSRSYY